MRLAVRLDDGVPDDCLGERRCVGGRISRNDPDKQLFGVPIEKRSEVCIASVVDS